LLLLGAGESGKSTLFKQMILIYGTDEKEKDTIDNRKNYIELIYQNIIHNAKVLAEACVNPAIGGNPAIAGEPRTPEAQAALTWIEEVDDDNFRLDAIGASHLKMFWRDPGIQNTYDNRALYQLNDSTAYFMQQIDRIAEPDWIPSVMDTLRTRVRTTGIVEHNFTIEESQFKMFDVGGQRNERKKWIHCFENVTAVLFVAAISEFDQVLYEDDVTNRMSEAIHLFRDISKSEWFQQTNIILFLNKVDLFEDKIKTRDINKSACAELRDYTGDCRNLEETKDFIEGIFTGISQRCVPHFTCATDTNQVRIVLDEVKQIIIENALKMAGLDS